MESIPTILIVENDNGLAKRITKMLKDIHYNVVANVNTGEEAIEKVAELRPNLVLMDIMLTGDIDGVTAAEHIRFQFNVPVVFLTAYTDDQIIQRAKVSEPFGYILKPFEARELHTIIEIALYKHQMETKLRESEQWLATTLKSISDAVITIDNDGHVKYLNPVAEKLTGWQRQQALAQKIVDVLTIVDQNSNSITKQLICSSVDENGHPPDFNLISKTGNPMRINLKITSMIDDRGQIIGTVLVFNNRLKFSPPDTSN